MRENEWEAWFLNSGFLDQLNVGLRFDAALTWLFWVWSHGGCHVLPSGRVIATWTLLQSEPSPCLSRSHAYCMSQACEEREEMQGMTLNANHCSWIKYSNKDMLPAAGTSSMMQTVSTNSINQTNSIIYCRAHGMVLLSNHLPEDRPQWCRLLQS